ncbi:YbhB/YbcL family Raf kinase inhibitor-like protein [Leptodesmis sp.]|uniref:YbhB/YbcL family Raf kinase inhibitor-like protein n=1 Tax=Leptodesmis sp. TaxID=3100501 RepID=UPI004053572F
MIRLRMMIFGAFAVLLISCSNGGLPGSDRPSSSPTPVGGTTMKLESPAFSANGLIPSEYTCDGKNISPPLTWTEIPTGTQSLALIVDDPDAPRGTFVHWVVYNLPATLTELPAHVTMETDLAGGLQGKNDFRSLGYGGPCPPSGTHRYFFKLYALDQPLRLPAGASKAQVLTTAEGHILASAELIGRYHRRS